MLKDNNKTYDLMIAGIFLAYLVFNGVLLAGHELWRDEANVWLMARELTPLELFAEIKYQGHPCLWYLLIMPFAKLGLPFRTIGIVSYLVMAAAAGLFLWKSPFNYLVKLIVVLSPIFTYFYPVIARNYCLIALLLVLLAWYYPERNLKPVWYGLLLGLLVQADTIAIAPAGMISLMWLCENVFIGWKENTFRPVKKILGGIWIPLGSLFLWVMQFYQVSDSPVFGMRRMEVREFFTEIRNFSLGIIIRMTGWEQAGCKIFLGLVFAAALALSIWLRNGWAFCVMAASFLFQAAFSAAVYQLHLWHFISLGFVFIWMIWVLYLQVWDREAKERIIKSVLGILQALVLLLAAGMFFHWNSDEEPSNLSNAFHGVYSDGKYTAEYIKEHVSDEELIISVNVPMASTVLAYLKGYEFYFAGSGKKASYADWSEGQSMTISFGDLVKWAKSNFPEKQEAYLLMSGNACLEDTEKLAECVLLYQSGQETARGEEYEIYKISLWNF